MGKEHPKVNGEKYLTLLKRGFMIFTTLVRCYAQEKVEDVYSIPSGLGAQPRPKR